jgi:hypothetical protein
LGFGMTAHSHPIEEAVNQEVGASALPTGLSSASPIEPASPSRPEASIPSRDPVVTILLTNLDRAQRNFIVRMKPHREPQVISKRDWDDVEPCVDIGDGYPDTYWFGGMRLTWPGGGRAKRVFQFNDCGIQVRAILLADDAA